MYSGRKIIPPECQHLASGPASTSKNEKTRITPAAVKDSWRECELGWGFTPDRQRLDSGDTPFLAEFVSALAGAQLRIEPWDRHDTGTLGTPKPAIQ